MSRFDSIVVGNDLVSEHWLAEQFPATVKAQRTAWKEREDHGKTTPRSGLLSLGTHLATAARAFPRAGRRRASSGSGTRACGPPWGSPATRRRGRWSAAARRSRSPPSWCRARPARTCSSCRRAMRAASRTSSTWATGGAGHLLAPAVVAEVEHTGTAKAVSEIFAAEEPPALVLVTAGGWLLLAERGALAGGPVARRRPRHRAASGATPAPAVSWRRSPRWSPRDSLTPADDGTTPFLTLLDDSVKHAVGVSKDLRDGVRESIELLASEVLRRRASPGPARDVDELAADLTRQSLRYLYRILFLLYAEARPSWACSRSAPPSTPRATASTGSASSRSSTSPATPPATAPTSTSRSAMLFRLVNDGYPPETLRDRTAPEADDAAAGCGSRRCAPTSSPRGHRADRRGRPRQRLPAGRAAPPAAHARKQRGKRPRLRLLRPARHQPARRRVRGPDVLHRLRSPATDLVEVAKDGDPAKGTLGGPGRRAPTTSPTRFVERRRTRRPARASRSRYAPGDFVFRLSGRDRQRRASYYTPEVLTRCVVAHALAELLDQDGTRTTADEILDLTVCEPALGLRRVPHRGDQPARRAST